MEKIKVVKIKDLEKDIDDILDSFNLKFKKDEKILLKPNFVVGRDSKTGVTTSLEILEVLIKKIKKEKAIPIIGESVGYEFDSRVFDILGIKKLVDKYKIEFVDFRNCKYKKIKTKERIFKTIELPEILFQVDKIINLPKLKTHMLTKLSISTKNLMGVLPLKERRIIHITNFDKSLVELNKIIKTDLTIVDASVIMHGRGPAFGDRINTNLLIAGTNVFCVDDFCINFLSINRNKIGFLKEASKQGLIKDYEVEGEFDKIKINLPEYTYYKRMYWLIYLFDHLQEKITKKTLIPFVISTFGVKFIVNDDKCSKCGKCLNVCPVDAIFIDKHGNYKIDFKKCKYVKCMKCYDICKDEAIKIRGISKPKNG